VNTPARVRHGLPASVPETRGPQRRNCVRDYLGHDVVPSAGLGPWAGGALMPELAQLINSTHLTSPHPAYEAPGRPLHDP
jgi:hypothetical protein